MSYLRVAIVVLLWLVTVSARADVLYSTLNQPLREMSHTVEISIKDGIAIYKVRRVFANRGVIADEAGLTIDLPYGAAATGLRIRAQKRWYDAELMEADQAAARYRELTGLGAFTAKDPALLQWLWADQLYLQVFPIFPGASSTVEYTLTVPTRYARGRVLLSYPRAPSADLTSEPSTLELPLAKPVITLRPSWGDAMTPVFLDGERVAADTALILPSEHPVSPWQPEDSAEVAGYAGSTIAITSNARTLRSFNEVTIKVDVEHTYRGDLRVELATPSGDRLMVFDNASEGTENDLRDAYQVALPQPTPAAGKWHLIVSDHTPLDAGTLTRWSLGFGAGESALSFASSDTPLFVPDAPESEDETGLATLELAAPKIDVLTARLGRVPVSQGTAFSRLEVDVAKQLTPLPKKAQLVFVVDASHSQGELGIETQLAMVSAYLSHVPDAELELVLYRRFAERLFGAFISAQTFEAKLNAAHEQGRLAPGNGSNLDAGARLASQLLQTRNGPLRVLITSDALLRPSFHVRDALSALRTLPQRAVVHVVQPREGEPEWASLAYDDEHALAPIAAAHHGIFAYLTTAGDARDKALRNEILALVRPTRIFDFHVQGLADPSAGTEGVLNEGDGIRVMSNVPDAPEKVVILGKIWGDPFRRELHAKARFSRATAGWVFGEDEHQELDEVQMMRVAQMGRAVSPVTSYLAVEPGVRPSTVGIPAVERGIGSSGYGYGSGGYRGRGGRSKYVPPDFQALAKDAITVCLKQHQPAPNWTLMLGIDTTQSEIVDVTAPAGDRSALTRCLVEALWAVDISHRTMHERDHFDLKLTAP